MENKIKKKKKPFTTASQHKMVDSQGAGIQDEAGTPCPVRNKGTTQGMMGTRYRDISQLKGLPILISSLITVLLFFKRTFLFLGNIP